MSESNFHRTRYTTRLLGHPLPSEWLHDEWLVRRLAQLRADPTLEPWLVRAVVLRSTGMIIGRAGFHTAPGADYLQPLAPDGVELGYQIHPDFRQRGYATETVAALLAWAEQEHKVRRFVLSISPENVPSLRIAQHFGFRKVGSHVDEEDGPEDIFLLDLDHTDGAKANSPSGSV